jgi:DNA repair protein RadA/Sms
VILLAGEPGIGKSTLLLEVAAHFARGSEFASGSEFARVPEFGRDSKDSSGSKLARGSEFGRGSKIGSGSKMANSFELLGGSELANGAEFGSGSGMMRERSPRKVLYLTGEESAAQVRSRALRVGALADGLYLAAEIDLGQVLGQIAALQPELVIVDSVQTIASGQIEGAAGGVAQVREVAAALIAAAKEHEVPMILVGHVTKDGSVAGPRTLEHLVDVVLQFEGGDPGLVPTSHSTLRMLRALKNRFGPTDEVGCFELGETGLAGLPDPSGLFLTERSRLAPGSCVTVTLEGRRPLAVELQALVAPAHNGNPRRATSGVESARLAMLLAVLARHGGLPVLDREVYLATVGGVRLAGPSGDLAAALAIASSVSNTPIPPGLIAIGEVGLAGDIRSVTGLPRRLAEAERLGFTHALVAPGALPSARDSPRKLKITETPDIASAVAALT